MERARAWLTPHEAQTVVGPQVLALNTARLHLSMANSRLCRQTLGTGVDLTRPVGFPPGSLSHWVHGGIQSLDTAQFRNLPAHPSQARHAAIGV